MTEDYKEKLIKYMTGNIEPEAGADEPQVAQVNVLLNDVLNFVKENYPEYDKNTLNINTVFSRNDYIILCCSHFGGYPDNRFIKAFIVVLDNDFNPLYYIDSYSSGSPLNLILLINENDNGTGRIYCIDNVYENGVISNRRVCILNDFTLSDFKIKQLSTFIIPKYNNVLVRPHLLFKKNDEGKYFMPYDLLDNNYNKIGIGALEFINNVGASNEWNFYPYSGNISVSNFNNIQDAKPLWVEENLSYKIIADYSKNADSNNNTVALAILKENISDDVKTTVIEKTINLPSECKNCGIVYELKMSYNNILFMTETTLSSLNQTYYLIYLNIQNENYQIMEKNEYDTNLPKEGYSYMIYSFNNMFSYFKNYNKYDDDYNVIQNILYFNQVFNDQKYEVYTYINDTPGSPARKMYFKNFYNLNQFYLIFSEKVLQIKQIFNQNNYNGLPYEDTNCLIPNSSVLYDTDDNIIFARNLYNKTVIGATTTSTVQIPNTMLNDVTIGKSDLISETNLSLTEDTTDITKNIYETVNINFANSISIRNDNDPNNRILNPTAAVRLNGSTTQNNNYDDVKATKVRVNYTDGTNMVIALNPSTQINALTDTTYQYNFILYVSKAINNLEIISNDELTSYQTIDNLTLEVGKTYNILQNVEVQ